MGSRQTILALRLLFKFIGCDVDHSLNSTYIILQRTKCSAYIMGRVSFFWFHFCLSIGFLRQKRIGSERILTLLFGMLLLQPET